MAFLEVVTRTLGPGERETAATPALIAEIASWLDSVTFGIMLDAIETAENGEITRTDTIGFRV
jgi:hypothetical protein